MLLSVLLLVLCVVVLEVFKICLACLHTWELLLRNKWTTHRWNEKTISHVTILSFALSIWLLAWLGLTLSRTWWMLLSSMMMTSTRVPYHTSRTLLIFSSLVHIRWHVGWWLSPWARSASPFPGFLLWISAFTFTLTAYTATTTTSLSLALSTQISIHRTSIIHISSTLAMVPICMVSSSPLSSFKIVITNFKSTSSFSKSLKYNKTQNECTY